VGGLFLTEAREKLARQSTECRDVVSLSFLSDNVLSRRSSRMGNCEARSISNIDFGLISNSKHALEVVVAWAAGAT